MSVLSNIAECAARDSGADFWRFLVMSRGSLSELEAQILLSNDYTMSQMSKML
ncbi:MAG: four helix bundle protein [Desulfobulbaceae bacterium]|nr:four helix bundle protein [Desulfobulbaceae bacterium]